jgi:hypothetical protein
MSIINETTLKNQPPDRRTGTGTSTSPVPVPAPSVQPGTGTSPVLVPAPSVQPGTGTSIPEKSGSDRGPGRWILSPDEMSMWWVPDGAPKPEEPPVGGQDHA